MFRLVCLCLLLTGCATNNLNAYQKEKIRAQLDAQVNTGLYSPKLGHR